MDLRPTERAEVRVVLGDQDGVISREQLLAAGLSRAQAVQMVRTRRWQKVGRGVYAAFTGPVTEALRVRAAMLAVGPPVAASHRTALWLDGLLPDPPDVVQLSVPIGRHLTAPAGVRIHRRRGFQRLVRPASIARTRVEVSVLDVTDAATSAGTVLNLVFAATQRRFTTAARLRDELAARPRHRWRQLLRDVLADVQDGVESVLELRYLHRVERAHGLPRGERNRPERSGRRTRFRDVRYRKFRTLVELDGTEAHPDDLRHRDRQRDNVSTVAGDQTLRYGWHDVELDPCAVAREVATVLHTNGWTGRLRRCPRCPA